MSQTQSFFNKINESALTELLAFMEKSQTELTLKIQDQYIKARIQNRKNENFSLPRFSPYEFSGEKITGSFLINDDVYFFHSTLTSSNVDYALTIPKDVFQLQRRNNFRVVMPLGLAYTCEIHTINGQPAKHSVELRDFSLGGCQISIEGANISELIHQDDTFEVSLKLHRFDFPALSLVAKHVKLVEVKNNLLVGCSLEEPNAEVLSELQAMLMYLDRIHRGKE